MSPVAAAADHQLPPVRTLDGWPVDELPFPNAPLERLVYYARLAPSSHNSQPWRFVLAGEGEIDVFVEPDRWLQAADPDRRELHVSLGCAVEALRIAADHAGWGSRVMRFPLKGEPSLAARVSVRFTGDKRERAAGDLLRHLLTRRTSHAPFEPGRPVDDAAPAALERAVRGEGVTLHFLREPNAIAALAQMEREADMALFSREDYREELANCIDRGLLGTSWLLSRLGRFAVGHLPVAGPVAAQDARALASAPLVGLLASPADDPPDQLRAGEAYLRLALLAEAHGLRVQPLSQTLEVREIRPRVAEAFGIGRLAAQHLFRVGHGPRETRLRRRRPLAEMLVRA